MPLVLVSVFTAYTLTVSDIVSVPVVFKLVRTRKSSSVGIKLSSMSITLNILSGCTNS